MVSVSDTGVLVIRKFGQDLSRLVWRDRIGREVGVLGGPADYESVHLSPDDRFVAITKLNPGGVQTKIWIASLPDGLMEPLSDSNGGPAHRDAGPQHTRQISRWIRSNPRLIIRTCWLARNRFCFRSMPRAWVVNGVAATAVTTSLTSATITNSKATSRFFLDFVRPPHPCATRPCQPKLQSWVPHQRPSFGVEWRFSYVQPDCRYYHRSLRSTLRLRPGLNGAPKLDCALAGPPAEEELCHVAKEMQKDEV